MGLHAKLRGSAGTKLGRGAESENLGTSQTLQCEKEEEEEKEQQKESEKEEQRMRERKRKRENRREGER